MTNTGSHSQAPGHRKQDCTLKNKTNYSQKAQLEGGMVSLNLGHEISHDTHLSSSGEAVGE